MARYPDPIAASPARLRKLSRDNQKLGRKLARHEFGAVMADLANPSLFDLEIDFPGDPAPPISAPLLADAQEVRSLPRLNVTLGTFAWDNFPDKLPVIGIHCRAAPGEEVRAALEALFTAHATQPFARFVFLCESLRLIPFLGRYELTFENLGPRDPREIAVRLHQRFGMREMRDLLTGDRIWRKSRDTGTTQSATYDRPENGGSDP